MKYEMKEYVQFASSVANDAGLSEDNRARANRVKGFITDLREDSFGDAGKLGFREYLLNDFRAVLKNAGINEGTICEIGGPHNSFGQSMPEYDFKYLSLYPEKGDDNVIVGDATQADHIPSESFDAIFSVSVFEHISKPWKAAEHLSRLLKPGGVCYHAAPFSYFYHGAPADFWRYTPDALSLIFSELKQIKSEFYGQNRRRDNRGSDFNPVDRDGGPAFAVDSFGGWRENWFTIYAGQKDEAVLQEKRDTATKQVIVNLMKALIDRGDEEASAAKFLVGLLKDYTINHDAEIIKALPGSGYKTTEEEVLLCWKKRGRYAPKVSYARYAMAKIVGI